MGVTSKGSAMLKRRWVPWGLGAALVLLAGVEVAGEHFEFGEAALQRRHALVALQTPQAVHLRLDAMIGIRQARSCASRSGERFPV
jgi:hypothetical protein